MSRPLLTVALVLLPLLAACPAETKPDIDLVFPPGVRAVATDDLALVDKQPGAQSEVDVREAFFGAPGSALPKGTVVQRVPADDPDVSRGQNSTVDPKLNEWILVDVLTSDVEGLEGKRGWVFSANLRTLSATETTDAPPVASGLQSGLVAEPATICPDASRGDGCKYGFGPTMKGRTFGCEGDWVRVEAWASGGPYVAGYLERGKFAEDPCAP